MVGSVPGCCPRAASGQAVALPASSVMNERRFTARSLPCLRPKGYHTSVRQETCAAGFQSSLSRRWVKRATDDREASAACVRIAPKAGALAPTQSGCLATQSLSRQLGDELMEFVRVEE